jgi:preprotein translocase subunit SecA
MKMFAGEWTIKVLGWIGMEEGMAIEDKRISKAILAPRKRWRSATSWPARILLEYDEVMDYQRTAFTACASACCWGARWTKSSGT